MQGAGNGSKAADGAASPLRKRFYTTVAVKEAAEAAGSGGFGLLLDGKVVRTPAKGVFRVPTRALAEVIAGEWDAQEERLNPATMPLTRLANSALDAVRGREADVRAEIVKYSASDLLCYRACEPARLVERQSELWDPVLAWCHEALDARFTVTSGLMPVAQPSSATAAVARQLEAFDAFGLAALHVMTTLMGSALLALAHARGRLAIEQAWAAAHVDEDWQISRWGEDAEAAARRERRWRDVQGASRLLALLA
jgi:chaperone required for assembly of F1-ATPase